MPINYGSPSRYAELSQDLQNILMRTGDRNAAVQAQQNATNLAVGQQLSNAAQQGFSTMLNAYQTGLLGRREDAQRAQALKLATGSSTMAELDQRASDAGVSVPDLLAADQRRRTQQDAASQLESKELELRTLAPIQTNIGLERELAQRVVQKPIPLDPRLNQKEIISQLPYGEQLEISDLMAKRGELLKQVVNPTDITRSEAAGKLEEIDSQIAAYGPRLQRASDAVMPPSEQLKRQVADLGNGLYAAPDGVKLTHIPLDESKAQAGKLFQSAQQQAYQEFMQHFTGPVQTDVQVEAMRYATQKATALMNASYPTIGGFQYDPAKGPPSQEDVIKNTINMVGTLAPIASFDTGKPIGSVVDDAYQAGQGIFSPNFKPTTPEERAAVQAQSQLKAAEKLAPKSLQEIDSLKIPPVQKSIMKASFLRNKSESGQLTPDEQRQYYESLREIAPYMQRRPPQLVPTGAQG